MTMRRHSAETTSIFILFTRDAHALNAGLEGGSFKTKPDGGAIHPGDDAAGLAQGADDVLALQIRQSAVGFVMVV